MCGRAEQESGLRSRGKMQEGGGWRVEGGGVAAETYSCPRLCPWLGLGHLSHRGAASTSQSYVILAGPVVTCGFSLISQGQLEKSTTHSSTLPGTKLTVKMAGTGTAMQNLIWSSTIPLHITHPSSSTPYLISVPRVSYLPLLLPRLTSFFGPCSSFSYEDILLKNLPIGLLCDLYRPELPWRLTLGNGPLFDIHDTFINSVKEVRYLPPLHPRSSAIAELTAL